MRSLDITKLIAILAFIGLAGFSCYWTAESLFIWQPSLTIYGAWMIAIVFYIVASICFGKLLKSLDNKSDYYGKPGGRAGAFFIAFFGLILFWLVVSMPTNTHTLLYRAAIGNVITNDLTRTQGYLQSLKDNNVEIKKINEKYNTKATAVAAHILRLQNEIENPGALGIGKRYEKVLDELELELNRDSNHSVKLQRMANVGSSRKEWAIATAYIQRQAYERLNAYRADCDREIAQIRSQMNSRALGALIANNKIALSDIARMKGISNNIIEAAMLDLDQEYSYIAKNSKYIDFKEGDKERYTREKAVPESREMLAVPKVWQDFLTTDKYNQHGFAWWILIALLVDISAFIFFNIAFNKKSNNAIAV